MDMDQPYLFENAGEREHLRTLANLLTDDQLARPLEAGWTVSAVLAHLAFWDQRALILIKKWEKEGIGPSAIDTDIVNDATKALCMAIPPRAAAELAISCAENIDQAIERLGPDMASAIEEKGKTVKLDRSAHRKEHLGQIERALGL